jgi:hypothetical protein
LALSRTEKAGRFARAPKATLVVARRLAVRPAISKIARANPYQEQAPLFVMWWEIRQQLSEKS